MPIVGNSKTGLEIKCGRCNSRRKVSRKWIEKIENYTGYMTLTHTEYKCTNKDCQDAFDKEMLAEAQKRERLKQIKLEGSRKAPIKPTT